MSRSWNLEIQICSSYWQSSFGASIHPLIISLIQYFRDEYLAFCFCLDLPKSQSSFSNEWFWVVESANFYTILDFLTIRTTFVRLYVVLQLVKIYIHLTQLHIKSIPFYHISQACFYLIFQNLAHIHRCYYSVSIRFNLNSSLYTQIYDILVKFFSCFF